MKSLLFVILVSIIISLAVTARDFDTRANYYRSQINNTSLPPAEKIQFYDLLLALHPTDSIRLYFHRGNALHSTGDIQHALLSYLKAYRQRKELNPNEAFELSYMVAKCEAFFEFIPEATHIAQELFKIDKPDSLRYFDVKAQAILYNCSNILNDLEEAERSCGRGMNQLNKWKMYISKDKYSWLAGKFFTYKGELLSRRKRWEESYNAFMKATEYSPGIVNTANYNLCMGNFYSLQSEYTIAEKYYRAAINDSIHEPWLRLYGIFNYAINLMDRKDFLGALRWVNNYDSLIVATNYDKNEKYVSMLSNIYEGVGDYRSALSYRRQADSLRNEHLSPAILQQIDSTMQQIYRDEFAEAQGTLTESIGMKIFLAFIATTMVCSLVILTVKLKHKNAIISTMSRNVSESQNVIEQLRIKVADNSQRLTTSAAQIAQVHDSLTTLREVASNPRSRKEQIIKSVQMVLRSIGSHTQVWEPFMEYMHGVNQGFLDKLYRLHPDLSNAEIRMCAFILLNRTTKEIASILNRSPRTVESLKYSLRRKMQLHDTTTEAYLRLISVTPPEKLDEVFPQGKKF